MSKQLLQQALECLEYLPEMRGVEEAITALREALAAPEPEPEPIRWLSTATGRTSRIPLAKHAPLYLAPPDAEALRKELEATRLAFGKISESGIECAKMLDAKEAELERVKVERDAMAKRLNWIQRNLFGHKWNGVIDSGSQTRWDIWSGYRHETAKMIGNTFCDAIDAAIAAKGGD